jgi:O-antigen ligase
MIASTMRRAIIPVYLFTCLLLGGSTRSDWPNLLLQLGAIAILAWAALAPPRIQSGRHGRILAILGALLVAMLLIQLIPLPPGLWSALPGRGPIAHGYDLLGLERPWLPLSLATHDTLTSALWLLPPAAILAGILRLGAYRDLWLSIALVAATFAGILLGALQVTSADVLNSPWYLYPVTTNGQAAGLFANSNHMATLMIATVPFLVAMYGARTSGGRRVQASAGKLAMLGVAMLVVLVGIALNHSLAGIGLGIPAAAASLFVRAPIEQRRTRLGLAAVAVLGLLAVAAIFVGPMENNLTAAGADKEYSSRYTSFGNGMRATADHFPVGSGVGTFAEIYPAYENPTIVDRWYINHVHNDYIEIALETGLPGLLLVVAFLLWWTGRAIAVWRAPTIDYYGRAASIASAAMLAHSMVEFPLRTSALAAVFAMCVALMAGPRRRVEDAALAPISGDEAPDRPRHLSIG